MDAAPVCPHCWGRGGVALSPGRPEDDAMTGSSAAVSPEVQPGHEGRVRAVGIGVLIVGIAYVLGGALVFALVPDERLLGAWAVLGGLAVAAVSPAVLRIRSWGGPALWLIGWVYLTGLLAFEMADQPVSSLWSLTILTALLGGRALRLSPPRRIVPVGFAVGAAAALSGAGLLVGGVLTGAPATATVQSALLLMLGLAVLVSTAARQRGSAMAMRVQVVLAGVYALVSLALLAAGAVVSPEVFLARVFFFTWLAVTVATVTEPSVRGLTARVWSWVGGVVVVVGGLALLFGVIYGCWATLRAGLGTLGRLLPLLIVNFGLTAVLCWTIGSVALGFGRASLLGRVRGDVGAWVLAIAPPLAVYVATEAVFASTQAGLVCLICLIAAVAVAFASVAWLALGPRRPPIAVASAPNLQFVVGDSPS